MRKPKTKSKSKSPARLDALGFRIGEKGDIPPDAVASGVRRSSGSYELVVSVVLMGLIGYGLDRWLNLLPIFTATLSILGFLGASISIYFRYKESISRESHNRMAQSLAQNLPPAKRGW